MGGTQIEDRRVPAASMNHRHRWLFVSTLWLGSKSRPPAGYERLVTVVIRTRSRHDPARRTAATTGQ